jgi:hypothetical protein
MRDPFYKFLPALLLCGCFAVYVCTAAPGVVGGDSGELLAAVCSRGAPHPPGYPLYVFIGKIALWLPWGSPAQRLNWLSALANAGAVSLLFAAVRRVSQRASTAWLAAMLFAWLDLSWRYATSTDVFALNNLCVGALLLFTARLGERLPVTQAPPAPATLPHRTLAGFGLLAGLALCNHQIIVFYLLAIAPLLAWSWRRALSAGKLAVGFLGLGLGLLPYLSMPYLFDSSSPWGWGDMTTWTGVWRHILRADYGTWHLSSSPSGGPINQFGALLRLWSWDLCRGSLGLVPAGLVALWVFRRDLDRRVQRFVGLWGAAAAVYILIFFNLADLPVDVAVHVEMHSRFWLQLHLVACGLAALGLGQLARRLEGLQGASWWRRGMAAALSVLLFAANWRAGSSAGLGLFEASSRATLAGLPQDAIVLTRGEHVFNPLRYLQACEHLRPDVRVLSVELMHAPWYRKKAMAGDSRLIYPGSVLVEAAGVRPPAFDLGTFLQANLGAHRPIFQCDHNSILNRAIHPAYLLYQRGWCQEIVSQPRRWRPYIDASIDLFAQLQADMLHPARPSSWEQIMRQQISRGEEAVAPQILLDLPADVPGGSLVGPQIDRLRQAIGLYEAAATVTALGPASLKNLGIAYYRLFVATGDVQVKSKMDHAFTHWLQVQEQLPIHQAEPLPARQAVRQLLQEMAG